MVAQHKQAYTLDDLRAIEALPENADKRFELIEGGLLLVNPPKPKHAYTADRFYVALDSFGQETQSGIAFSDSVGYDLPNGDSLIPDASFVSREQVWFPLPDDNFTFAPLVAVEVESPSNSTRELYDKAESFLECGTKIVWIAYIVKQIVDVCRRSPEGKLIVEKLGINAIISGEDVLPGFSLLVKNVFQPQE